MPPDHLRDEVDGYENELRELQKTVDDAITHQKRRNEHIDLDSLLETVPDSIDRMAELVCTEYLFPPTKDNNQARRHCEQHSFAQLRVVGRHQPLRHRGTVSHRHHEHAVTAIEIMETKLQDLQERRDTTHVSPDDDHFVLKGLLSDPVEEISDEEESFGVELSDNALAHDQATPTTEPIEKYVVKDLLSSPAGKAFVEGFFNQSGLKEKSDRLKGFGAMYKKEVVEEELKLSGSAGRNEVSEDIGRIFGL
jgi:hypothetical protein